MIAARVRLLRLLGRGGTGPAVLLVLLQTVRAVAPTAQALAFTTVRMADRIVVLDDGRVTEQGSHADLMAAGGAYADLYRIQERAYR